MFLSEVNKGQAFKILRCSRPGLVDLSTIELGIHPNAEGRILQKHSHAMVVNIDGARLAIGQEQAKKIEVEIL